MKNLNDLQAFMVVAKERSFTKVALRLGVSPSALSHAMRGLEERLGLRLLSRTTRDVATTEAGERLVRSVGPLIRQIGDELDSLSELRNRPAGSIRITCSDDAAEMVLRPKLAAFLAGFPEISVEIIIDYGFVNIVRERFDAGIRLGESIDRDMISVRLGPDWRLAVVGTPAYFDRHGIPSVPHDLTGHACINIRHSVNGGVYIWEFEKDGHAVNVRVGGQLTSNSMIHVLNGALDGIGLAYAPDFMVAPYLADGTLKEVLADWSPYFSGFHLYYPNRRQTSPAFAAFVEAIRYRE